jgi:uncharacterized protein YcbX
MIGAVSVRTITVYPIKSLDGIVVPAARILSGGALERDREFALLDENGKFINGKRDARIHRIRADYDLERLIVSLRVVEDSQAVAFHLVEQRKELERWFGDFLGGPVFIRRNQETGFPDDLESPGPTIVGSATLQEVGSWFGISDPVEVRRRFRPTIELATEEPFWEDRLFGISADTVGFQVGDVSIRGVNPCQRCVVPSRHPSTGGVIPDFQAVFIERREAKLPSWAEQSRFNHYYRLSVNTRIPPTEVGKWIRVGDAVIV